jgi:hypothetical protein
MEMSVPFSIFASRSGVTVSKPKPHKTMFLCAKKSATVSAWVEMCICAAPSSVSTTVFPAIVIAPTAPVVSSAAKNTAITAFILNLILRVSSTESYLLPVTFIEIIAKFFPMYTFSEKVNANRKRYARINLMIY